MAEWVNQYAADRNTLSRRFRMPLDPIASVYRDRHTQEWLQRLDLIAWDAMSIDDAIDWNALRSEILFEASERTRKLERWNTAKEWVPYTDLVLRIGAAREHGQSLRGEEAAALLDQITQEANRLIKQVALQASAEDSASKPDPLTGLEASDLIDQLLRTLQDTHRFLNGYDPAYSWWAEKPFEAAKLAVTNHRKVIREKIAGLPEGDNDPIIGIPIGDARLREALRHAWIAYSPDDLIRIGAQEMEWCDREFERAANELRLDGDWRGALEQVKALHVEPGDQPRLIRELAWEAIRFLEANELVTVPDLAKHGWRLEMMSPEAQRVNPYFLGGENIIVSFPTDSMSHAEKLMSLRSNNIHFCRATVHHELIPGHHLQSYAVSRFQPHRALFETPFWTEGWALYWEMLLWDLDFHQSVEDRIGMLFWRRHRAARIFFSLNYQTGRWTAQQCVDYLVERVGHEPSAAAAEVRRSIMGGYGPLYQAAYLIGGLQFRKLHEELVQSGEMTNLQFHDAILKENQLPIELIRYKLTGVKPERNAEPKWLFYDFK